MAKRSVHAVNEARKAADFLDGIGEHKRANDVRHVCRSNDSFRVTLSTLHRDNMALREKLKLPLDELETIVRGPWIEWAGGKCPIPHDQLVDVKWNNGAVSRETAAGLFATSPIDLWESRESGGHIVAYRVVESVTP